jgi:hypothetical protein
MAAPGAMINAKKRGRGAFREPVCAVTQQRRGRYPIRIAVRPFKETR